MSWDAVSLFAAVWGVVVLPCRGSAEVVVAVVLVGGDREGGEWPFFFYIPLILGAKLPH